MYVICVGVGPDERPSTADAANVDANMNVNNIFFADVLKKDYRNRY